MSSCDNLLYRGPTMDLVARYSNKNAVFIYMITVNRLVRVFGGYTLLHISYGGVEFTKPCDTCEMMWAVCKPAGVNQQADCL